MGAKPDRVRLLLVDDHPFVRQGLRAYLMDRPNVRIVGEADRGESAIALARRLEPDVVLMDVNLPRMSGIEAVRILRTAAPRTRVLMLTVHTRMEYVIQIIQSGAHGYVAKGAPPAELLRAIMKVARGGTHFPTEATLAYLRDHAIGTSGRVAAPPAERLAPREREVLSLVAEGMTNKQIAASLGVSARTVETHRERLKKKLGLRTVAELTRFALANELARPPQPAAQRRP